MRVEEVLLMLAARMLFSQSLVRESTPPRHRERRRPSSEQRASERACVLRALSVERRGMESVLPQQVGQHGSLVAGTVLKGGGAPKREKSKVACCQV